jgi:glyoxylase-like metal-dependent hydrolase (beta-lactamase superfamily II)
MIKISNRLNARRIGPLTVFVFALLNAGVPPAAAEVRSPVLLINEDAATASVTVKKLRGNISVLTGSGGNIAVYVGPQGKFMVDSGIAVSRPRVEAALDATGSVPLKYVVNTHYHWDHTDGNEWIHQKGATVVAHENTLSRLTSGTRVIEWGFYFPPAPKEALPTETVKREKIMKFEDETVVLRNYGSGHTDTDLSVYFKNADVLHVGDIWWNGHYPFLDNGAGGSIDGLIRWVNECIKASGPDTLIIPGHGEVSDRKGLTEFRDMLVSVRGNVARLKRQGKTLAETIAAKPTARWDAKYGDFLISPAFFIQMVYMDV